VSCLTGSAIAKGKLSDHIDYDAESFYLACLFHDIGCVPENIKKSAICNQLQLDMKLNLVK
jgi:cyanamide hydratase